MEEVDMQPLKELKPLSFIYEIREALEPELCREMIRRFEAKKEQQYPGRIGQGQIKERDIKASTDLRISGREDWKDIDRALFRSLSQALGQIAGIHPFFRANAFKDMGYNMQRTRPGEYYHWHVDSGPGEFSQRQLVALWYLNDVEGPGGETEFLFQGVKVKPEEGKLILFPPFWTHVHRGVTLKRGVKYIATTWVCYA
ncbi:MAG: 2OG-Fe(II) oxygenase [Gammaproteobacteria bacterium]|nr:MAG: 2OG-Fe(II) oxygenase [Gammaproteobacteria bacterium]